VSVGGTPTFWRNLKAGTCRQGEAPTEEKMGNSTAFTDNRSDFGWVVQKFGGTSVGKFPDKVSP
jgi:hypothetical protein